MRKMRMGDRRRRVGLAIARNIEIIAAQILAGWRDGPDSIVKKLDDPAYAREATIRIATDLLGLFQLMRDAKLEAVLGKTIEVAKPRLAEGWRSGRSIQGDRHQSCDPARCRQYNLRRRAMTKSRRRRCSNRRCGSPTASHRKISARSSFRPSSAAMRCSFSMP